jgi:hypothetical protein
MRRVVLVLALLAAATAAGGRVPPAQAAATAASGAELARADFDDDGLVDLAVGIPGEDHGQSVDLGAVHLLFGSAGGLTAAGSRGLFTEAEPGDRFGAALGPGPTAGP